MNSPPTNPLPERSSEAWLERLTREWREPGDLDATLDRIAETAQESFGADVCVIFAINPVTRIFTTEKGVAGDLGLDQRALRAPRQHGLTQRVIDEGFLAVPDSTVLDDEDSGFCRKHGIRSFAAVALHTLRHGRPFAVLYVDYLRSVDLDTSLAADLRRFAQVASRELQVTWLLRRYQWVGQIGQQINRRLHTQRQLFTDLCQRVCRIIDTSHCFFWAVHHPEDDSLELFIHVDGQELPERRLVVDERLRRLMERSLQISSLADETPEIQAIVKALPGNLPWRPQSLVFVPLRMEGRPLGILSVQHHAEAAFDDEDRHLLELLGNHVSLAQSNLRLLDHLRRLQRAGQTLTQNLESENVLQEIVEAIQETTGCDLAILYPYSAAAGQFELPPKRSGPLKDEEFEQPRYTSPPASLTL